MAETSKWSTLTGGKRVRSTAEYVGIDIFGSFTAFNRSARMQWHLLKPCRLGRHSGSVCSSKALAAHIKFCAQIIAEFFTVTFF